VPLSRQDGRSCQQQEYERAERITKAYKDKGYVVARAFVPAQDVRDGVVEIRVVEGRYERIDISNASDMS
jgi:hemolysin activation/secretion protein